MLQAWPEYGWLTLVRPSHCHHPKPWTTARPGPRETGRTGTCGVWTTSLRSLETCWRTPPLPHPDGCMEHAWARRITCRDTLMEGGTQQDISSDMSVLLCRWRDKEPSGKTPASFVDKLFFCTCGPKDPQKLQQSQNTQILNPNRLEEQQMRRNYFKDAQPWLFF